MALPTKATHQQTRVHNERLVVRTLYDLGPISRAEVARLTGLTRTTVSDVVATLLDDGVVREIGRGPSSGGKAPILLQVDDDARLVVGLDLGEEHFAGSLVNLRGEIRRTVELAVDGRDGDAALALVFDLLDQLLDGSAAPVLGIGIGTPGLVDSRTRHDPARGQPRLARPAARRDHRRALRRPGQRRQRFPGRGAGRVHLRRGRSRPEPDRDPRRAGRRGRPDPARRAVPGRRLGRRRDRPRRRRRRRRPLPLRSDGLSRDGRRDAGHRGSRRRRNRSPDGPGRACERHSTTASRGPA